ncbi:DUF4959 domain-containing protein [Carboxylicivirga sediminis]|uniref:DUF4959 domain-containing protein n=1 Tax=Carboxylicivirga sediminis TaxID=2006564 RepID=A0A941F2G0_9BACT|nr:DUF4959 domain-containing protein [Carboxylicivirga sediminis]MBR8535074.1 DUF4959 domain-containing protein [Carboxylicivirga sediminis]
MKPIYKYLILMIVGCMLFACEKEEGETTPPGPVSNIEAISDYGSVKLSWTNPTDEDLFYVDINYTDEKGKARSVKASKYSQEKVIEGFGNTDSNEFTLTAYDENGNASEKQSVTANANTPPYELVIGTVDLKPDFGGVKVSWVNETGKKVKVVVSYTDEDQQEQSVSFNALETGVGSIGGLTVQEYTFSVIATDVYEHKSEPVIFTATPLVEEQIDRTGWAVVDFSSEEPAEGAPNGLVTASFDGELGTFWHTQWNGGSPDYPHWFIIDMGQQVAVSKFECYRRQGDSRGQTKIQLLGSVDGITWTDYGEFDFDATIDDGQQFAIAGSPQMRYFKYVAVEGPNFFAFLSEIYIYGGVIQ